MKIKITKIKGGPEINKEPDHVGTCKKMKLPQPYNHNDSGFIAGSDNPYQ